jgi:branched-chain amino acid aminotransferase
VKKYIFKNHQLLTKAQVSIHERGFLFGDGIFETCKIFNGKIYDYKSHEGRLIKGLKALKFTAEISDLEEKSQKLIKKNQVRNGLLRISISRGIGSKGYLPTHETKPLIIIETLAERKITGKITLGISSQKTPHQILGKTMNSLPYILNKIEAQEKKLFDLVMFSQENFIGETSSANIFWVKNNQIFTSSKSCGIIAGTMRGRILELSSQKIYEVEKTAAALKNADEIFLTNSAFLVLGVDEFMGRKLQKNYSKELHKIILKDIKESCKN